MATFTIADLRRIIVEAAGQSEEGTLDGDILEVTFEELGYDSIAMLETASRVEREMRVTLPDEMVTEATTPRKFIDLVEERLTEERLGANGGTERV
jgi:act minimal PKS acyl carrier protein